MRNLLIFDLPNRSRSYEGSDLSANVAYNMVGSTGSGTVCPSLYSWIIAIWLGTYGDISPISVTGSPVAAATFSGVTFDVYKGSNPLGPSAVVHTFVATENATSFRGDLLEFANWIVENDGASEDRCIHSIQGGSEIYGGTDAVFKSSSYSVQQVRQSDPAPSKD